MSQKSKQKKLLEAEQRRKQTRNFMILSIGLVIVIGLIATLIIRGASSKSVASFNYDQYPVMGSADAPVQVVEFGDFKCPVCKLFSQQIEPLIKKDFVDTGKVRFYFVNYPFIGKDSTTAAIAGESVFHQNPDAFWTYYHAVYNGQGDEKKPWATPDRLVQIVQDAGIKVDFNKMKQDIQSSQYKPLVKQEKKLGDDLDIGGTPTIVINGKVANNLNSYQDLAGRINQVLQEADTNKADSNQ